MNPTPEQLAHIESEIYRIRRLNLPPNSSPPPRLYIEIWESIRPSETARITELEAELKAARAAFLAVGTPTIKPLQFPDPPSGYGGWHNPENLTPEQVGIDEGWRLCLKEEQARRGIDEISEIGGPWMVVEGLAGSLDSDFTYRTREPLPPPKPTPEELDRTEFEKAMRADGYQVSVTSSGVYYGDTDDHFAGWQAATKAARKGGEG